MSRQKPGPKPKGKYGETKVQINGKAEPTLLAKTKYTYGSVEKALIALDEAGKLDKPQ